VPRRTAASSWWCRCRPSVSTGNWPDTEDRSTPWRWPPAAVCCCPAPTANNSGARRAPHRHCGHTPAAPAHRSRCPRNRYAGVCLQAHPRHPGNPHHHRRRTAGTGRRAARRPRLPAHATGRRSHGRLPPHRQRLRPR
jgi:hypothetical protein